MHFERQIGVISFNLAGVSVKIDTTDTVGITLNEFQDSLNNTALYRSERIAIKHIDNLRNEPESLEMLKNHIDELLG